MTGTLLALVLSAQMYSGMPQFQRLSFNLPVAESGGVAIGLAGAMEYLKPDYIVLSGGVDIKYGVQRIQGQRVEMDLTSETVLAEGDVILDIGPARLSGQRLDYDLGSETGTIYDARAALGKDLHFYGAEMSKVGPDTYILTDGILTACESEKPAWSFKLAQARVVMEGFARIYNTTMRVRKMPFLYAPFLMVPAKSERASGLLTPNLGYSSRRGSVIGLAWFQTMGDSYDATVIADHYSEGLSTLGLEFRYTPVIGTRGIFEGLVVDDKNNIFGEPGAGGEKRWRIRWNHLSRDLPLGLTAAADVTDFSDFNFFRDFSRNFDDIRIRNIQSRAYLQGSWGKHAATLLVENQEQFIRTGVTRTRSQLPELEYSLRSAQIGDLPIYFSLGAGAHGIQFETTGSDKVSYQRMNVGPRISIPFGTTWLSAKVDIAGKAVMYSDSLSQPDDEGNREFTGESITQSVASTTAQIVGPSVSKVFHSGIGQWAKFKHVVEPRWEYSNSGEVDDPFIIPNFDQVDNFGRASERLTFRFVNRLLAKPEDEAFGAREIMSLEIAQSYSFKDDQPLTRFTDPETGEVLTLQESPIDVRYRFRPGITTYLDFSTTFNTLFNQFNRASVTAGKIFGRATTSLTYSNIFDPKTGDTVNSQVRLGLSYAFLRDRLRVRSGFSYDAVKSLMQQQSHNIDFITQCWGLHLELREYKGNVREERDVRFSISLKNVGSFIGLNSSTRDSGF